ncbi:hypothetical protein F4804DRAFT_325997 [Jackrogersella minutella]|nr:hypothetical protein F4804DRAFT_325997 [Jackrogersella minutella]
MEAKGYTTTAFLATLLSLTSVVSAAPFVAREATGLSTGFNLIATIVGSSKQLSVPIQGAALEGAHVGAGLNTAVLNATSPGQIFYQNGTVEEVSTDRSSIVTDGGTPLYPYGLDIILNATDPSSPVAAAINVGIGTQGVTLTTPASEPGVLHYGTTGFMACDETLAYYGPSWHFAVVKTFEETAAIAAIIPDNCVQINLLPLCATLEDLPAGSVSSHEFANEVRCFESLNDIQ